MQQRLCMLILALLVVKTIAIENICNSFTSEAIVDPFEGVKNILYFGIGDNPTDPLETQYYVEADWGLPSDYFTDNDWNSHLRFTSDWRFASVPELDPFFVNTAPLSGGHNRTNYNSDFVRTANLECASNHQSFMWGPAYSDLRLRMTSQLVPIRSIDYNLEVYVHVSAPNTSSYFRYIAFITNQSNQQQKLQLRTSNNANYVFQDLSPLNDGRYVAGFPWADSDPGQNSTFRAEWASSGQWLTSIHARGASARERRYALYVNANNYMADFGYNGDIEAGETKAVMVVYSFAMNKTAMLQRAAWVDSEPAELFHDLTADQLSQIANWGACQSVLGPDVTVTVTPPSSCSSDMTSDFTAKVTTNRSDLSTDLKHRVVLIQGTNEFEIVAAQSSTTLSVLNNIGQVKHQLWFKNCIVKETVFTACSNKPSAKRAVVANVAEDVPKKSSTSMVQVSTSLIAVAFLLLRTSTTMRLCMFVLVLLVNSGTCQSLCNSFTKDMQTNEAGVNEYNDFAVFNFGINDSPMRDQPMYSINFYFMQAYDGGTNYNGEWNTQLAFTIRDRDITSLVQTFGPIYVNNAGLHGGRNYTTYSTDFTRTADLICSNANQTFTWGPAYPDVRQQDLQNRAQHPYLETYVQVSAPSATNYLRYIAFITNKSNKQESLQFRTSNDAYDTPLDVSPYNSGRYVACFPFRDDDDGNPNVDFRTNYNRVLTSVHARGLNARETAVQSYSEGDNNQLGAEFSGTIEAGETKAFMIVYSFAPNKTRMLQSAAWVDAEPAELFHGLNADQLSQIVNWGACQKMLAPDVTVTVTPPSQCSSDMTSDFTVSATTTRSDFTSSFSHRVVGGVIPVEIVPVQSSNTLTVINDAGPVVHQLWYNGCMIKETPFTACETVEVPQSAPVVGSTTPTGKTSSATTLTVSAVIIGVIPALL